MVIFVNLLDFIQVLPFTLTVRVLRNKLDFGTILIRSNWEPSRYIEWMAVSMHSIILLFGEKLHFTLGPSYRNSFACYCVLNLPRFSSLCSSLQIILVARGFSAKYRDVVRSSKIDISTLRGCSSFTISYSANAQGRDFLCVLGLVCIHARESQYHQSSRTFQY